MYNFPITSFLKFIDLALIKGDAYYIKKIAAFLEQDKMCYCCHYFPELCSRNAFEQYELLSYYLQKYLFLQIASNFPG